IAVRTARGNARRNAAAPRVTLVRAAGTTARTFQARGPFDLVLANILLRPLQHLAFPLAGLLTPNARVILSGLFQTKSMRRSQPTRPKACGSRGELSSTPGRH